MRAIMAAVDFSGISDLVVAEAAKLARAHGGKVVLITVLVEPVYLKEFAPLEKNLAKISVAREQAVRNRLVTMQEGLRANSIPAETIVRHGNAAQHIVEEADEHDAAFIVMGSHGHTAFYELILGSTTQAVLKQAHQAVVVIPPTVRSAPPPKQ